MDTLEERVREMERTMQELNMTLRARTASSRTLVRNTLREASDFRDLMVDDATTRDERITALELGAISEKKVRELEERFGALEVRVSGDILTMAHFLGDQDKRIRTLESALALLGEPVKGEVLTTEPAACPVCGCYADHDVQCRLRPNPEPAAPKPASLLVTQVRDRVIAPLCVRLDLGGDQQWRGTNAYAEDALREFANWLDSEADRCMKQCEYAVAERYARTARHVRAQLEP